MVHKTLVFSPFSQLTGLLARERLVEDKVNYCHSPLYQPTFVYNNNCCVHQSVWFGVHGVVHNSWLIRWCYGTWCTVRVTLRCCHAVQSVLSSCLLSRHTEIKSIRNCIYRCFVWVWKLGLHSKGGTLNAVIRKRVPKKTCGPRRHLFDIYIVSEGDSFSVFATTLIYFKIELCLTL